jgi:prepilin-type N-terminal cleavage/methylation domain-containing protein
MSDFIPKFSDKSFTLVELIIVVIIVGILAAIGLSQYNVVVERSRTVEAKTRLAMMRSLTFTYYLDHNSLDAMSNDDVGAENACSSSSFFKYYIDPISSTGTDLVAYRCTNGGKPPDASRAYVMYLTTYPGTGLNQWHCYYVDNSSSCFGMSP